MALFSPTYRSGGTDSHFRCCDRLKLLVYSLNDAVQRVQLVLDSIAPFLSLAGVDPFEGVHVV